MEREIKFNAVDTDRNIVYKYNEWFEEEGTEEFHNENLGKFLDEHYGCKLLQYTGLKIKNQEVYESDIVKARKDFVYKVVFENGSFVLYHLNRFADKENVRWGLLSRLFDSDMQDILKECEVIGNIYETQNY